MNKNLLVNEVSKLLGISSHTIRYYDKEGLIKLKLNERSGYREFDMNDIINLLNVIILRESEISIRDIKSLTQNYSSDEYERLLKSANEKLDMELMKIKAKKQIVENTIGLLKGKSDEFKIVERDKSHYDFIKSCKYDENLSSREFYDIALEKGIKDIKYKEILYKLKDEDMEVLIVANIETDYSIDSGSYLEYTKRVLDEAEIDTAIGEYYNYAKGNEIPINNDLWMTIDPHAMLSADGGYYIRLFSKIKS
ncbi:MAG: MerR family transcriptional regulator [Clostridia bacterium]|jgi:DNA-binding transcriptional MerR regulator|nr:MerR family transcriptional regulator [Clostridia bacterium]